MHRSFRRRPIGAGFVFLIAACVPGVIEARGALGGRGLREQQTDHQDNCRARIHGSVRAERPPGSI